MIFSWPAIVLGIVSAAGAVRGEAGGAGALVIEPKAIALEGAGAGAQLVASIGRDEGILEDWTDRAAWLVADPAVATIDSTGYVRPVGDGETEIVARANNKEARVRVRVTRSKVAPAVGFEREVLPALTKAGCNQGACHGTPTGKNGFRLSLRGYDPELDYATLTRESGNRRVNRLDPDASLILLKGSGAIPHQGGQRFTPASLTYRLVRDWIAQGLARESVGSAQLVGLEVEPAASVMERSLGNVRRLTVRARYSDGSERDVTRLARFASSDETIATVDTLGAVRARSAGEAVVMVGLASRMATARVIFLDPQAQVAAKSPEPLNFIDEHVFAKLKLMRIVPSPLADDATFLRRVRLDLTGLPPSPEEVRAFLADAAAEKRNRKIDELLASPEHVDFWALKWSDRLGCNQRFVGIKGAYSYHRWIRDQVARNVPFDVFARAIITAKGPNYENPPASFYRRLRSPEEAVESVSQIFLGMRLQCARCHNHVSEQWTQDDYYGMAAFFSRVRFKDGPHFIHLYNKEETVYLAASGETVQPRTGKVMKPKALLAAPPDLGAEADRREALAEWVTSAKNPFFARAAVNRIWHHLLGRGIVDPVDDMRDSNPPASEGLLSALADDFVAHGYDVRRTIGLVVRSATYQLASETNESNERDTKYFSHAVPRLLSAEQLLDAISKAAGSDEPLFHFPQGTRSAELPDGELVHPFLKTFGRPERALACECERGSDTTLEQALAIVGGRTIHARIEAPHNRIGALLESGATAEAIVDALFLATLSRLPDSSERALAAEKISSAREGGKLSRARVEDLLWSLFNHPEFLFQH